MQEPFDFNKRMESILLKRLELISLYESIKESRKTELVKIEYCLLDCIIIIKKLKYPVITANYTHQLR